MVNTILIILGVIALLSLALGIWASRGKKLKHKS